jgi:hypothetical protein
VPLDPIVSLSVALAEAPGSCAFFLGSGVSRDAGVPTGGEILREGLRRLHQLDANADQPADDEALDAWQAETGREHITYSDVLELIAPDQAIRREYLAGFFAAAEPGQTHERLAALAVRGLVKVFVTTNFDRLLEHALQARGVEPVVLASDADLEAATPREHAGCVVIKPHGDYLRQTIRNTPEELAELEPGLTQEISEVFDRYGVVVIGYSGSDAAIARTLRDRRSRYGLWWVARGELGQPAAELVEATGGRVVRRETAAEFLRDLERRLRVFEEHPSGITPPVIHDEVLALVRANDAVGLEETLRREGNWYESAILEVRDALNTLGHPTAETVAAAWETLRPALERRLASWIPLGIHSPDRFGAEVERLARSLERVPLAGGVTLWLESPEYAAAWLAYVAGALLTRVEQFMSVASILSQAWTDRNGHSEQLAWLPNELGDRFGRDLVEGNWISPTWTHLTRSLAGMDWLEERYPELYATDEPGVSLSHFDMLNCIWLGTHNHRAVAFFELSRAGSGEFARLLHVDSRLRGRVAEALEISPDEFTTIAAAELRNAFGLQGGFVDHGVAANILETGNAWT